MTLLFSFIFFGGHCQNLSESAEISVITLSPFQGSLYSAFGHSAFRVKDFSTKIDLIFNYGTYYFEQPNFYWNFITGDPYYKLSINHYDDFERSAIRENRIITEQILNLNQKEKQKLFEFLIWNSKPENCFYYYNYIYNNCATKIRDVLDLLFPGNIQYNFSYKKPDLSFRDLMDFYLQEQPWGDLGIDICLGLEIDKEAEAVEYMFLPDYVMEGLDGAVLETGTSLRPLIKETRISNQQNISSSYTGYFSPLKIFILLLLGIILVTVLDFRKGQISIWLDVPVFSITGIIGCFLLFLWFFTNHLSENNYNLFWAIPLNLPAAFVLIKRSLISKLKFYLLTIVVLQILLLFTWTMLPQPLNVDLIPVILIIIIRSYTIFYIGK